MCARAFHTIENTSNDKRIFAHMRCPQVIRLSGYSSDEKLAIARRYLEPQAAKDAGVPEGAVRLDDDAMNMLINEYCRCALARRGLLT